ncbi:hypothetical protein TCAL_01883 [Tigriopus californicus]|uniref:Crossover junction endonuclease MUS81 n=1 Tax=Tigriopus californicus TaxID=6832 RepID=A0A553P7K4_TIGCA|nr:crossover junction endonuclease MUS81-like [Tigriopus californicus]TRY73666.1 hypothetical protein TCAL_01883 [Tigriopus californicus]|eukprot:TCALIF_01883-PA protein Name:"Similar to mus81 Crossover junction endonuclease MUS81 (Xenopus tropicalis)" AED:0.01 eAED:0.01 QI:0/1/0.87/1/0.71/0.87/8/164/707
MAQIKKRRKIQISNPNPVFENALQYLIESNADDLVMVKKYEECLLSLKKYPLKLNNLSHCKVLSGFDQTVIDAMQMQWITPKAAILSPIRSSVIPPKLQTTKTEYVLPISESKENDPDIELAKQISMENVSDEPPKLNFDEDESDPDLVLARQLSQEWNGVSTAMDLPPFKQQQEQQEEDRMLALKLNQDNYMNRSWSAPEVGLRRASSQFETELEGELTSKRVSGVIGGFRIPVINPNEVEITPPPSLAKEISQAVPKSKTSLSARAKLFSQDPILRRGTDDGFDLDDGDDSIMAQIGQNTSISKPWVDPSKVERNFHSISDSDEDEPAILPPKPSRSKNPVKSAKAVKGEKRKCSKKKTGVEFIPESSIPKWVMDLRSPQLIDTEEDIGQEDDHPSEFTLPSGEYEIVLIVDFAEVTGGGGGKARGTSNKKATALKELTANGVSHETRKLHVGDFIWIAKEKVTVDPSRLSQREPRELVLPYIVERKRMDDLKNSIIDGRYKEQKTRLRDCGLPYRWYLVEEFNKKMKYWANGANGQKFNLQALEQAMASTSAVEGFNIKRTEDLKESVAFLTLTTRFLQDKYCHATLRSWTHQDLDLNIVHDADHVLLSFKEFNDNSRKNKPLTVKDGFTRILCCQHGVTWPMASAIADEYSTLANLMEVYANCQNSEERENLLAGLSFEGGKRLISAQVSKIISWLFSDEQLK